MGVRAAAVQFAIEREPSANLLTCRRMIDRAAAMDAELIVLPGACNHPAWYDDVDHARSVAITAGDEWSAGIAERARAHRAWIVVGATRLATRGRVLGSSFLYGPDGTLAAVADTQVVVAGEPTDPARVVAGSALVHAPFATLGAYSCLGNSPREAPRALALSGAQVLLGSLSSFADGDAILDVPVRAAESRVFVVAANAVAPLLPPQAVTEVAARAGVSDEALHRAGGSQIVAPDGTVLAAGPEHGEGVILAEIDPARASDKTRPDATDRFGVRRPQVYASIVDHPARRTHPVGAADLAAAVLQPATTSPLSVAKEARAAALTGARLIVLPELPMTADGTVTDLRATLADSAALLRHLDDNLDHTGATVVTSVVEHTVDGIAHVGIVIDEDGVLHRQRQLHAVARHPWVEALGDRVEALSMPWGRLAVVVGDDAIQPESVRLAALDDADVVAVPFDAQERWETVTGLVRRSAENRVCIVAATRPGSAGTSLLCSVDREPTMPDQGELWTFEGPVAPPLVTRADEVPGVTAATLCSRGT